MSKTSQIIAVLSSNLRHRFLAELLHWLTMSARASYTQAGKDVRESAAELRCHNELALVIATQLQSSLASDRDLAYPDAAFLQALKEESRLGQCEGILVWALEQTLERVH